MVEPRALRAAPRTRLALAARLAAGALLAASILPTLCAQPHRFEYDGFTVELRELFTARCDAAWVGFEVVIENTGGERIEPTIAISTTLPGTPIPRRVEWSTVVSPGSAGAPAVRRELIPVPTFATGEWYTFLATSIEVYRDGARLEPKYDQPEQFQFAREQHWQYASTLHSGRATSWYSWGNFHTLVIAAGDEPEGWRKAFTLELLPSLRTSGSGEEGVEFRTLAAEAMPVHPEAYEGIDRVVLIGLSPDRVAEPQRQALRAAVRAGLRVWLIPDGGGAGNEWVWPPELCALGSRACPLPTPAEAAAAGGASPGSRPHFLAGEAEPGRVRDTIAVEGEEIPISVAYPEGTGAWLRLTAPIGPWRFRDEPTERWDARSFAGWLEEGEFARNYGRNVMSGEEARTIASVDDCLRRKVDPRALLFFVVIYLLVAGPGLFVWLKRSGRLPRLLWMQPLVVAIFLAGTGLLGWFHFGVASRSHDTFVLVVRADEPGARLLRLSSLYASVSSRRDLPAGAGTLPIPVPAASRGQLLRWRLDGGERGLADFRTRTWSLTHFASGVGLDTGPVRLRDYNDYYTIENGLPVALRRIGVPGPDDPRHEGPIPAGASTHIDLELSELFSVDRDDEEGWDLFRRHLWEWPSYRSDLRVRCVAEFDPSELPSGLFPDRADESRGYVVILGDERSKR